MYKNKVNKNKEISMVEEPQFDIKFYQKPKPITTTKTLKEERTLNLLSLFSGCGGMDLGFEGGFSVLSSSVNEILTPHFIEKKLNEDFVV